MALEDEVITVVSRVINVPITELTVSSGLGDTKGWDSLNHTILVLELENAFDVAFDFDELDSIVTVGAIAMSLKKKLCS